MAYFNGILEEVTKDNINDVQKTTLENLVSDIFKLAVRDGYYEFVPGYFLADNNYLIEYQKAEPNNILLKGKDLTKAPFWIMQHDIKPCDAEGLNIAEIIIKTEGLGNEL